MTDLGPKNPLRKIFLGIAIALISFGLSGCEVSPEFQGSVLPSEALKQIKIGMNEQQVLTLLGHPCLVLPFDPHRFYYINQIRHIQGIREPYLAEVKGMVVGFDAQGIVREISPSQGPQQLVLASEVTSLKDVSHSSFMRQLFGSAGPGISLLPPGR